MAMNRSSNNIYFYYNSISKIPLLSKEREMELMIEASKGSKKAQDILVESNLRFVIKIANLYKGKGLDLEDLIAEGNSGLIMAASKVDPEKNVRFITYASWWIKQAITKALYESGKTVRIPLHRKDEFNNDKWDSISIYENCSEFEGRNVSLCDIIADEKTNTPEEELINLCNSKLFDFALESLSPLEQKIIIYRYGLDGNDKLMLSEIGEILGVSRETIRQKEIKIIKKIKNMIQCPENYIQAA